ncbi:SanA/YdcF family protein [Luteolibacter marinus]|uniref:SanA/YdcF family protein n=1 Tax=Luteolibacter marinus TaxID=2776705 RepID=UPI001866529C|nr:ElyC/SanA/YdcF family protein [Luteolibacter marinus]
MKRTLLTAGAVVVLGLLFVVWTNLAAVLAGRGLLYNEVDKVPGGRVGLVFGTDDRIQGKENLYFRYRIDAAEELWKAGKLRCVIVSGFNNEEDSYNEPRKMRQALIDRGVPGDRIVFDFAGVRTLDSVVRAKKVFEADEVTFISQKFHNERAMYLAKANGMKACGYNARDVEGRGGLRTKLREVGARVLMWLDVHVLDTQPKYLGERVALPQ